MKILKTMKRDKVLFWIFTTIIVLFEGVMPAIFGHSQQAIDGVKHLGYPDYFRVLLNTFKITGSIVLILPFIRGFIKEWAYAGFTFNFIAAAVSHAVIDGTVEQTVLPVVILCIHMLSYIYYHKTYGRPDERINTGNL